MVYVRAFKNLFDESHYWRLRYCGGSQFSNISGMNFIKSDQAIQFQNDYELIVVFISLNSKQSIVAFILNLTYVALMRGFLKQGPILL